MRYAIAVLFAMSSASAMADNQLPNVSDDQVACAGSASQEFETANAAIAERATANGSLSIEDTIAQRRLSEDFCKRWAGLPGQQDHRAGPAGECLEGYICRVSQQRSNGAPQRIGQHRWLDQDRGR
jgi:hypothetical protein